MALTINYYKNLYKDLPIENVIDKYTEIKNRYIFQGKNEKINYIIESYLEPNNDETAILVLEDILREQNMEKYIIKDANFNITLDDIISFIAKQKNDLTLKIKLTNFFEKLSFNEDEKVKFLLELVQDKESFINFTIEISNECNRNEVYNKYKKIAKNYCAMHFISA